MKLLLFFLQTIYLWIAFSVIWYDNTVQKKIDK